MKKILLFIAVSLLSIFSFGQNAPFIKNVAPAQFKTLTESGKGIVLDVRTPEEIAGGYINNASMINFYDPDFERKINLMDKSKEIYVYCRSGGRSSKAANILLNNGFTKVYNLDGGIMAWQGSNLPLSKTTAAKDDKIQQMSVADLNKLLKANKTVLVDFHTQWCAPCKQMAPIVDKLEQRYKGKAAVLRIDIDKCSDIAKAYTISGVPVFVIYKNGKEVWRYKGAISEEELKKKLDANL